MRSQCVHPTAQRYTGWADRLEWTIKTGGLLWNPTTVQYSDLFGVDPEEVVRKPHIVGITREIEMNRHNTWFGRGSWIGALFEYEPPRIGFSVGEQKLLLAALAGGSTDQALAATLDVSVATVKKMWVSIYR